MVGLSAVAVPIGAGLLLAQEAASPKNGPTLVKLGDITYPPIARAAHISGTVEIDLVIRPDGSVQQSEVISGPRMLSQAALDSARGSTYVCRNCDAPAAYKLTYAFSVVPTDPPKTCDRTALPTPPGPKWDASRHEVSVFAMEVWTCDPAVSITTTYRRVRSAKCLFLWACGLRKVRESAVE